MNAFEKSRRFIYRNARPLDLARFRFHFESASRDDVLNALSYYQNEDGGFGYALEADCWNPNSSPIQTWAATEILREIDFAESSHPIICGILRYLEGGSDFNNHFWRSVVESNNDYPHAPWWHTESGSSCHNDYNPTACLAGFIVKFAKNGSELHNLGCRLANEAYSRIMLGDKLDDMHTIACFVRLLQYVNESGNDCIDTNALEMQLREIIGQSITRNRDEWAQGYVCKPSQFFCDKCSAFCADNSDIADYECEFIEKTQLADGSWNIPWGWSEYAEQWAISKNWWKSDVIIKNLLYLRGFDRLAVR